MKHFIIEDLQTGYIRVSTSEATFNTLLELGVKAEQLLKGKDQHFSKEGDFYTVYFIDNNLPFVGCTRFGNS
jgi:hypothetical protein